MKTQKLTTQSSSRFFLGIALSLITVFFSVTTFAEQGAIRFSNNAYKQVITTAKNGEKKIDYIEPKLALPGDVILYRIEFENISKQSISNIVINSPLPNNSTYRDGSASGKSTEIYFSVDGGNFKRPQALMVKDKTGKSWLAKAEDYKAIRWIYTPALKPGEKGQVSYKTEIRKTQ